MKITPIEKLNILENRVEINIPYHNNAIISNVSLN